MDNVSSLLDGRWMFTRGRIAEAIEMVSNALRSFVTEPLTKELKEGRVDVRVGLARVETKLDEHLSPIAKELESGRTDLKEGFSRVETKLDEHLSPIAKELESGRVEIKEGFSRVETALASELSAGRTEVKKGFSRVETALASELSAGRTEVKKGFTWLGGILGVAFVGIILALLAGWMILDHSFKTRPPVVTPVPPIPVPTPTPTPTPSPEISRSGADRGWDVWNQSGETLEIYQSNGTGGWKPVILSDGTTMKLGSGEYLQLPCRNPNLHILFQGSSFEHELSHVFRPSERTWHQRFIRKT